MFSFYSISSLIGPVLGLVGTAIGGLILRRLHTPTDHDRAVILAQIANGAASLVVSLNPTAKWKDLLVSTITAIESAAGLPTKNAGAIERAAADGLARLGVKA